MDAPLLMWHFAESSDEVHFALLRRQIFPKTGGDRDRP
jgi:hypothetical protein